MNLQDLADAPRWIAWRQESRGANGKPTKVPYGRAGIKAEADNPSTWCTRSDAERLKSVRAYDGIGLELGALSEDEHLAGIDLDACITDAGVADWAKAILAACPTYAETSPSGTGIKLFFRCSTHDARQFLRAIGCGDNQWGAKRTMGTNGANHGPAVEVYFSHRYFAVTEQSWIGSAEEIALLPASILKPIAALIPATKASAAVTGPDGVFGDTVEPFAVAVKLADAMARKASLRRRWGGDVTGLNDTSRSGLDFSLGTLLKASKFTASEMRALLIQNPYSAGREHQDDERYFQRIGHVPRPQKMTRKHPPTRIWKTRGTGPLWMKTPPRRVQCGNKSMKQPSHAPTWQNFRQPTSSAKN